MSTARNIIIVVVLVLVISLFFIGLFEVGSATTCIKQLSTMGKYTEARSELCEQSNFRTGVHKLHTEYVQQQARELGSK